MIPEKNIVVNWPTQSDHYKVVQVIVDDVHYTHFSAQLRHGQIIYPFLFGMNIEPKLNANKTALALEGERYKIAGMGHAEVTIPSKKADFYGDSLDYKIGIEPEELALISQKHPEWAITLRGEALK